MIKLTPDAMNELTQDAVEAVFLDCLFREGEPTEPRVTPDYIVQPYGFHPERLESHRTEVASWIEQLPDEFLQDGGGGWTFLNLCMLKSMLKNGEQWTGLHARMEQLFELANGLGLAEFQFPRDYWQALPGGVPYIVFKRKATT